MDAMRPRDPGLPRVGADPEAGRLWSRPGISSDPSLPAGEGSTSPFGEVRLSPAGSATEQALVRAHELVHRFLTPRFGVLRTFRVQLGMSAYLRSAFLQYLEEAIAETVAQLRVNGFNGLLDGVKFPVANGYVSITDLMSDQLIERARSLAQGRGWVWRDPVEITASAHRGEPVWVLRTNVSMRGQNVRVDPVRRVSPSMRTRKLEKNSSASPSRAFARRCTRSVPLCLFLRPLQSETLRLHGCGIVPISMASHYRDAVVPGSEQGSLTLTAVSYIKRLKNTWHSSC